MCDGQLLWIDLDAVLLLFDAAVLIESSVGDADFANGVAAGAFNHSCSEQLLRLIIDPSEERGSFWGCLRWLNFLSLLCPVLRQMFRCYLPYGWCLQVILDKQ